MLLEIFILVLAIPSGFLIAWMARDELVDGRVWFRVLTMVSFALGCWFYLIGNYVVMDALFFIMVVSFVSYVKSKDKTWVKGFS